MPPSPSTGTPHTDQGSVRRWLKPACQALLVAIVLFFLGRVLVRRWDELQAIHWQIDVPLLAGSFGLLSLAWLALVANWRWLMSHMGAPLGLAAAWRIWFLSNIVRYIPGNVWQFLGMVYLCEKEGIARTRTAASILVYQAASVASGLLAGGAVFLLDGGMPGPADSGAAPSSPLTGTNLALIAAASFLALAVCTPLVMNWGLRRLFALLHREPVQIELGLGDLARFFVQRLLIWVLQGAAFAVLVRSIYPAPPATFPILGAAFALSWVLGFVTLLTPSGLGVREAAQTALLAAVLPLPASVALALLSRLWLIAGEAGATALGLALGRRDRRATAAEAPRV